MSESDLSKRRRQALDLLLQGRISHEQYEQLRREIEQTPAQDRGTLTGQATGLFLAGPQAGEILEGRFELLEPLGRGAMGVVWKAHDSGGDRFVCLKFLPPEILHDGTELGRVKEVFARVHALQHQYLCPFYLLGDDSRYKAYVVMKFVAGRTLNAYRQEYVQQHGGFPLEEAIWIAERVAQALDYVHQKRLVHRDVKPANILVDRAEEDVQLVDLGLAAEVRSSLTRISKKSGELAGTAPYMAPEQWRGQFVDGRADQYSLAVTIYELLAGHLPFDAPNEPAWMHCALHESIPVLKEYSEQVNGVLMRALSKMPQDRFETCTAFVRDLQASSRCVSIPVDVAHAVPGNTEIAEIDWSSFLDASARPVPTSAELIDPTPQSLPIKRSDPRFLFQRAVASLQLKDYRAAIRDFTELLQLKPDSAISLNNRGLAYSRLKECSLALDDFNEAVRLDARCYWAYYNRCVVRNAQGDVSGALADVTTAISLNSSYYAALNQRAWIYATNPNAEFRRGKQAVEDSLKACKLTDWKPPGYIDTLAAAYAEVGDFKKAIKYQEQAIKQCRLESLLGTFESRLALYRTRTPYREVPGSSGVASSDR